MLEIFWRDANHQTNLLQYHIPRINKTKVIMNFNKIKFLNEVFYKCQGYIWMDGYMDGSNN